MTKFETHETYIEIDGATSTKYIPYKNILYFNVMSANVDCLTRNHIHCLTRKNDMFQDVYKKNFPIVEVYLANNQYKITPINLNNRYCVVEDYKELDEYKKRLDDLIDILKKNVLN